MNKFAEKIASEEKAKRRKDLKLILIFSFSSIMIITTGIALNMHFNNIYIN